MKDRLPLNYGINIADNNKRTKSISPLVNRHSIKHQLYWLIVLVTFQAKKAKHLLEPAS